MSFLAVDPRRRAGSGEIAKARHISRALIAKLLTQLASAGVVSWLIAWHPPAFPA